MRLRKIDIAKKVGISSGRLSQILHGTSQPKWDLAKKLADLLGTDTNIWMDQDLLAMNIAIVRYQFGTQPKEDKN